MCGVCMCVYMSVQVYVPVLVCGAPSPCEAFPSVILHWLLVVLLDRVYLSTGTF